ncbi:hypothetical protein MLD38_017011 [Melastoma candidum]|uniref:Uncharacterized protein n=1 Tax=Melastoma candidum TaxID=119954 RepID=A0ACB9QPB6_9MYRT|nr:hypothetical protein MLD38_017011 [Melastoma candidum]
MAMSRSFALLLLLAAVLFLLSSFEVCDARRGRHWRQQHNGRGRVPSSATSRRKSKGHGDHHGGGSKSPKHKLPPPPPTPAPAPLPSPPPAPAPVEGTPHPPSLPPSPPSKKGYPGTFNVLEFGAVGDGSTDDTKAFEAAWASACKVSGSVVAVPAGYSYLVGPISFSGPYCQPDIVFQLDGTIVAPTDPKSWGRGLLQWLEFTKLKGISIQGTGTIDGRGSVWWEDSQTDDDNEVKLIVPLANTTLQKRQPMPVRGELSSRMPSIKPTALRFYGSFNVTVTGITIQNSPQCHLKFDSCMGVSVHDVNVSAPGDSPNTDGIHLQNSRDVLIRSSYLACGDDCVSIQTGCSNVYIHNVNCGPGHGISIGSLGRDNTKACVSNITVRDVNMHNTMTGVRIKTWQGGSGSVQGVMFSNIQVSEVQFPIMIDQFYCDKTTCKNQSSAVALSGITYERIRGTYTVKPAHFACSDSLPCMDVTLTAIELKPLQEAYHLYSPFCWQTFGELSTPTVPPIDCLQIGKPSSSRVQAERDSC